MNTQPTPNSNAPIDVDHSDAAIKRLNQSMGPVKTGASYQHPPDIQDCHQTPVDLVDELSMESFPCSDPPASTSSHI